MKKFVLIFLSVIFITYTYSCAQNTIVNTLIAKDSIKLGGSWRSQWPSGGSGSDSAILVDNTLNKSINGSKILLSTDTTTIASLYALENGLLKFNNYYTKAQSDGKYLQNFTETDPVYNADKSNIAFSGNNVSIFNNDVGYLTNIPASYIQNGDNISELNNNSGFINNTQAGNQIHDSLKNKLVIDTTTSPEESIFIQSQSILDFPATDPDTISDLTMTVNGASEGDIVSLGVPNGSITNNGSYMVWVSSDNTVTIRYVNNGTETKDPTSGTFKVFVVKQF